MDLSFKHLSIAFVILSLGFLTSLLRVQKLERKNENLRNELIAIKKTMDSLKIDNDSLYSENFPCQIELSRFQTAYQIFLRRNPKAASQLGDIISDETE